MGSKVPQVVLASSRRSTSARTSSSLIWLRLALCAGLLVLAAPGLARAADPVLAAVGDIACGATTHSPGCAQSATAAVVATQAPQAVAVLGDNQYDNGSLSEFNAPGAYNDTWGQFNLMVRPVLGNHEYGTTGANGYFTYFGAAANGPDAQTRGPSGSYSYDLGSWHVIALNSDCYDSSSPPSSVCPNSVQGTTTSAEVSWLQSDLAAHPGQCILAYWHHPLFSSGWVGNSQGVAPFWNALYAAHADVVINGHDHMYERFAQQDPSQHATADGIREFVSGTGGESLFQMAKTPQPNMQFSDNQHFGVLFMTLHANSYDWKFIATDGSTRDGGSTACHAQPPANPAPTTSSSTTTTSTTTTTTTTPSSTTTSTAPTSTSSTTTSTAPRSTSSTTTSAPPTPTSALTPAPSWATQGRSPLVIARLLFHARPDHPALMRLRTHGLPVHFYCSAACDVRITVRVRRGGRLVTVARFFETESEITSPSSTLVLRARWRALRHLRVAHLQLMFAAHDAAGQRAVVVDTVTFR